MAITMPVKIPFLLLLAFFILKITSSGSTPAPAEDAEDSAPPMTEEKAKKYCWMQTGANQEKIDDFHIKQKVDNKDYVLKDYVTCFLTKIKVLGKKGQLLATHAKNWLTGKVENVKQVLQTCESYGKNGTGIFNDVFRFLNCTWNKGNVTGPS